MQHVLSMINVVELSKIFGGIAFSRYKKFNLFLNVNVSFTKLSDDPESKSAWNRWRGLQVAQDVSERKKELGERDMVFRWRRKALLMFWQPFWSAECEGLPISLPGLVLGAPQLPVPPVLCYACLAVPV